MISQLAYIMVGAEDLDAWQTFAEQVIGGEVTRNPSGALFVRIDQWEQRIVVVQSDIGQLLASAWAVREAEDWHAVRARFVEAGIAVSDLNEDALALRGVKLGFEFDDPAGNHHEIIYGRSLLSAPFVSPVGVSHFVTGNQGVGHVVLPTGDQFDACAEFWRTLMDVGLSDFAVRRRGDEEIRVHWYHLMANSRHHSVAIAEIENPKKCIHFMLQVGTLDDVGLALDRCHRHDVPVKSTLGRHVNDGMYSFYLETPSGFELEYGFGAYDMDWSRHEPHFTPHGSHWGHKRI